MTTDRFFIGIVAAIFGTVVVHAALGLGLGKLDSSMESIRFSSAFRWQAPAKMKRRAAHGSVAYERRKLEEDCSSIPECQSNLDAVVVELKLAKLGSVEQDPKKLPEIQQYEEPEKIEEAVNIEKEPTDIKPLPLQDFMKKKAELDKKYKKPKKKIDNLFNVDDDPRANATAFEKIVGRADGDVEGFGTDQSELDSYFARCALELHKEFHVPASLSRAEIQKNRVLVLITKLSGIGEILEYRIKSPAANKSFTQAAEAAVRSFVPSEGGRQRLPEPSNDVMDAVNTKGVLIALDGRLFQ